MFAIEVIRSGVTADNFRKWIVAKHTLTEKIGDCGDCYACPIAMFMMQTFGLRGVSVSPCLIEKEKSDDSEQVIYFSNCKGVPGGTPPVPDWVVEFIEEADNLDLQVTVIDALNILAQIEEKEKQAKQLALV